MYLLVAVLKLIGVVVILSTATGILFNFLIVLIGLRNGKFASFSEMMSFVRSVQQMQDNSGLGRLWAALSLAYRISVISFIAAATVMAVGLLLKAIR